VVYTDGKMPPSPRLAPDFDFGLGPGRAREGAGVNEFYKKGCQEKSSASTGGEISFLEIQPTEVSLL